MPIEFLDLLAPLDAGWVPLSPGCGSATARWSDGGTLADAPVDVAATFEGAAWRSTRIDPSFGLTGVRLRGGFSVPTHRHDAALLVLVFAGSLTVRFTEPEAEAADEQEARLGAGQFCVIEAETEYSLAAGEGDATFLTSWPQDAPEPVTTWSPDPAWKER